MTAEVLPLLRLGLSTVIECSYVDVIVCCWLCCAVAVPVDIAAAVALR